MSTQYTGITFHDEGFINADKFEDYVDSRSRYRAVYDENTLPNYLTQLPPCHEVTEQIYIKEEIFEEVDCIDLDGGIQDVFDHNN